jgi:hypothetical protein
MSIIRFKSSKRGDLNVFGRSEDDLLIEKIEEVEEVKKESKDLEEVLKVKDVSHQVSLIFERIHL